MDREERQKDMLHGKVNETVKIKRLKLQVARHRQKREKGRHIDKKDCVVEGNRKRKDEKTDRNVGCKT